MRVYSNIPISGRFKADFLLVKPVPPAAASSASTSAPSGTASAKTPPSTEKETPAPWPRDRALEAQLARRGIRGVTILRRGRSLKLRGRVRDDAALRSLYRFVAGKGFGEVDYGVEVSARPGGTPAGPKSQFP